MLPPLEKYIGGGTFSGPKDVRVMEKAKTLQVATWLHRLNMAVEGDQIAHSLWRPQATEGALSWICFWPQ